MTIIEVLPGYGVDRDGFVYCNRSINGKGNKTYPWRVVKPLKCSGGRYLQIGADDKKYLVHRLVAFAFLGPCPIGYEVAHLNGKSHQNNADNLCYKTNKENNAMKKEHGTDNAGEKNHRARLTSDEVLDIRMSCGAGGYGIQAYIAKKYRVSQATISNIINNKSW